MKTDEIRAKKTLQNGRATRKNPKYLGRRKGNMQEKPNLGMRQSATKHGGHETELIVVHPNQIARLILCCHGIGKTLVDRSVAVPIRPPIVQLDSIQKVVKQRPKYPIGKPFVVMADFGRREVQGDEAHRGKLSLEPCNLLAPES